MAGLIETGAPIQEPISLADAKQHLRVTINDDDTLISGLITVARHYCETYCNRAFAEQSWALKADVFPIYSSLHLPYPFYMSAAINSANPFGTMNWLSTPNYGVLSSPAIPNEATTLPNWGQIFLPKPPLVSVDSILYIDPDGNQQTLDPSTYVVVTENEPGYIKPMSAWPGTLTNKPNVVTVNFTCGFPSLDEYGHVNALPATIKQAMKLLISLWYEHREPIENQYKLVQGAVHALLDQHRQWGFF